jgi:hypothetical protein
MVTIGMTTLIGIIFQFKSNRAYRDGSLKVGCFIDALISGGVFGFYIGLCLALLMPMKTEFHTYANDLGSSKDSVYSKEVSVIGSEKDSDYIYYYKAPEGIRFNRVSSEDVIINYTDMHNKVIKKTEKPTTDLINLFSLDMDLEETYEFFIPTGNIGYIH